MPNKIYIITETVHSNAGHGMGSDENQALARYWNAQEKRHTYPPAFASREQATAFARTFKMMFVKIVELPLQ